MSSLASLTEVMRLPMCWFRPEPKDFSSAAPCTFRALFSTATASGSEPPNSALSSIELTFRRSWWTPSTSPSVEAESVLEFDLSGLGLSMFLAILPFMIAKRPQRDLEA